MALSGSSYEEILKHYYQGTSIQTGSAAIVSEETGMEPGG